MTENINTESTDDTSTPPANKGSRRQTILIVVLLLMGGGLIYDRQVARPRSQQAYDKALELINKNVMTAAESEAVTNQAVQAAFGKKPSKLVKTEDYTIETFSWRRGLLVLRYDVNVVYAHEGGRLVLRNVLLNKMPEKSQLPGYVHPPVLPPPGEG